MSAKCVNVFDAVSPTPGPCVKLPEPNNVFDVPSKSSSAHWKLIVADPGGGKEKRKRNSPPTVDVEGSEAVKVAPLKSTLLPSGAIVETQPDIEADKNVTRVISIGSSTHNMM